MARFAVGFGNRGFFPPEYMKEARQEIPVVLRKMGHKAILMPEEATRLGAVETREEGKKWGEWLTNLEDRVDGVIWTHPNFGDEVGMLRALQAASEAGYKTLLHGYPDKMDKMGKDERRDAFCGIISTMDVLNQYGIEFVKLAPHVVSPGSKRFKENIDLFEAICAGTIKDPYTPIAPEPTSGEGKNVLEGMTLLALGARTTPFMTCRYDELAAAKNWVTIETADLSKVFHQMMGLSTDDLRYKARAAELKAYTNWERKNISPEAFDGQVRFSVILDEYVKQYNPAAVGVRCWTEFQEIMKISPCASMSLLNHNGTPTACEVDLGTATAMYVMKLFESTMASCQDWNNNFREGPKYDDKFCFMHCGPHDTDLLKPGHYVDTHGILDHAFGEGTGQGCIQGRFKRGPVTIGGCTIEEGKLRFYFTEGRVTQDELPKEYFGSAGVAEVPGLQGALLNVGHGGFKHHFAMGNGHVADRVIEALKQHEGYEVTDLRKAAK